MDGLERELKGQITVLRLNVKDRVGVELARRHQVRLVPTFIVYGANGREQWRQEGALPDRERILREVGLF